MNIPNESDKQLTLSRFDRHKKKYLKRGITDIRTRFKGNLMFLEVVKEQKSGMFGKFLGTKTVRGVGKIGRLEYLGPNKWKLLIYKHDANKYGPHPTFQGGTIEECIDAIAGVFF